MLGDMNKSPVVVTPSADDTLPAKPERKGLLRTINIVVGIAAVLSVVVVVGSLPPPPGTLPLQLLVFVAVATAPHWLVEFFAWLAVTLGADLKRDDHKIGFRNPGAYLGMVERVLFLASLVAGYPSFIAVWFVLKGVAGYRVEGPETRARRTFQLYLLNNAVSLLGVALGWLAWKMLGL